MAESEIPVMVAVQQTLAGPKFSCLLIDKGKTFSALFKEVAAADHENNLAASKPTIKVSTTETGDTIPFHERITVDQASKMLRSDILWVTFQLPLEKSAPPPRVRNAFEVLINAQQTKSSLPIKYPKPINGSFELFNELVSLCQGTGVFFRY